MTEVLTRENEMQDYGALLSLKTGKLSCPTTDFIQLSQFNTIAKGLFMPLYSQESNNTGNILQSRNSGLAYVIGNLGTNNFFTRVDVETYKGMDEDFLETHQISSSMEEFLSKINLSAQTLGVIPVINPNNTPSCLEQLFTKIPLIRGEKVVINNETYIPNFYSREYPLIYSAPQK